MVEHNDVYRCRTSLVSLCRSLRVGFLRRLYRAPDWVRIGFGRALLAKCWGFFFLSFCRPPPPLPPILLPHDLSTATTNGRNQDLPSFGLVQSPVGWFRRRFLWTRTELVPWSSPCTWNGVPDWIFSVLVNRQQPAVVYFKILSPVNADHPIYLDLTRKLLDVFYNAE